jgi:hypothetical protein
MCSAPATQARLIIHPQSVFDVPAQISTIKQALRDTGLLADEFSKNMYYVGENFIQLITFLGCSPAIQLSPEANKPFCYIEFSTIAPHSRLLGHCRSATPKCPNCKNKINNWKNIDKWQIACSQYTCNKCAMRSSLADLKWRQLAGYGRFSINIINIHPHEAVPAEKIFSLLRDISGFEWNYFYANNEIEL